MRRGEATRKGSVAMEVKATKEGCVWKVRSNLLNG